MCRRRELSAGGSAGIEDFDVSFSEMVDNFALINMSTPLRVVGGPKFS